MEFQAAIGPESGGGADFIEHLGHEGLAAEAGDDGHAEEEIDLIEKGPGGFERSGGIEGKTGLAARFADAAQGFFDIVIGLDVDGDEIGAGGDETRQVMVRTGDHQVDIKEDVIGLMDGLNYGGTERNVVHEVAVHHIEMHPIGAGMDGAGGFLTDAREIRGEKGRGDDAVCMSLRNHGAKDGASIPGRPTLNVEIGEEGSEETGVGEDEPIIDLHSDAYFMGQALREARRAYQATEVPIGAVIVREGRVIARAWNQVETLKDATAHAEMLALTAAQNVLGDWRLDGCTLYVTKEPCPMCAGAIVHCRPGRVVFGCPDPKAGAAGGWINLLEANPPLNHRCEVTQGVLGEECLHLIQGFFREAREKKKLERRGIERMEGLDE